MSVYPLAYLVSAPFVGFYIEQIGRKRMLTIGILIYTLGTLMFALGGYCKGAYAFFSVSFFARLC